MMNIRLKLKVKKSVKRTKKINIDELKNKTVRREYQARINQRWEETMKEEVEGVEEEWNRVKSINQSFYFVTKQSFFTIMQLQITCSN